MSNTKEGLTQNQRTDIVSTQRTTEDLAGQGMYQEQTVNYVITWKLNEKRLKDGHDTAVERSSGRRPLAPRNRWKRRGALRGNSR